MQPSLGKLGGLAILLLVAAASFHISRPELAPQRDQQHNTLVAELSGGGGEGGGDPPSEPLANVTGNCAPSPPSATTTPLASSTPATVPCTIAAQQFGDPFYAFIVGIALGDSLGLWTSRHLQAYFADREQESSLPLKYFQSLERRAIDVSRREFRRGITATRIWRLTLSEPLRYPMPYSILGYHLGSLSMARVLVFSEWRLGDRSVYAPNDRQITRIPVSSLMVFRLDDGWIVMDVHRVLDRLLGRKLDDCWTQGFAICRREDQIHGLALSLNRDLRPRCGEIDFATNEITPMGGPLARGVAVYVRPWVAPPEGADARIWRYDE